MTVFLRLHSDDILAAPPVDDLGTADDGGDEDDGERSGGREETLGALGEWRVHQARERERLDALVGYCAGVVGFLRSPRT
jgi:hypothetical protein